MASAPSPDVLQVVGRKLDRVRRRADPIVWKSMSSFGPSSREIGLHVSGERRVVSAAITALLRTLKAEGRRSAPDWFIKTRFAGKRRDLLSRIAASGLFDTRYYLAQNPDVAQAGIDPLAHYLGAGAAEARNPHPLFATSYYLAMHPDAARGGVNPLVHYVMEGAREGRDPHPLFDTSYYLEMNPDVARDGVNPLVHYVMEGGREGRDPHPLFDTSYYLEMNPDVARDGVNPLVHYVMEGGREGRDPHPLFDTSYYLEMNPDVARDGVNPLVHYFTCGAREGRDPHALFDTSFYLEQKPEVAVLGMNPLAHFLKEGPGERFDPLSVPARPPDSGVCIVTPDIGRPVNSGGIGTACHHFARTLVEAGHAVSIFFTGDLTECQKAHWRNVYAKMHVNFIALSDTPREKRQVWGSSWFLERSWRVFQYLREASFSVVHFQDWQANGFWSIKAKQVGCAFSQTVLTVMTHSCTKWINQEMRQFSADPFETVKLIWAETYSVEHCDVMLSPSHYMFSWATENQICCPARMVRTPYTYSGVEPPAGEVAGQVDNDHLIFWGPFDTTGLRVLGEALRQLRCDGAALPTRLSLLGKHAVTVGGPPTSYLEELKQELENLEVFVIENPNYAESLNYIRESRGLLVMPSILENDPLTVIECILGRIPFLAATTGGLSEMIDDRVSFEPTPSSLSGLLSTRHAIDHGRLEHKYSASHSSQIWCDLHVELFAMPQAARDSGERERYWHPAWGRRVSVCIPFFNHQRYLATLVEAFSRQRYPDFEVILVNDGSAEDARREFERIAVETRDARFRFLTTENRGPGSARNFAAGQASGELLVFFDADNLPKDNEFIGTLVRALQESGADCVTCPYDVVGSDRDLPTEDDVISTCRPIGPCLETGFFENNLGDATMIIDRTVVQKVGGWSDNPAFTWEDHAFLLNLCFRGFKLETVPDALYYYRQGGRNQGGGNLYLNYECLFQQLQNGPPEDLARILGTVAGPMLLLQRHPELSPRIVAR